MVARHSHRQVASTPVLPAACYLPRARRMPDRDPIEAPANPELELDPADEDSTVGTGSVLAIGCSIIVIFILIIGVALFISRQM